MFVLFCAVPNITSSCTLFDKQTILKSSSGGILSDNQLIVTSHIEFFSTRVDTNDNSQSKHHKLKYFNYIPVMLKSKFIFDLSNIKTSKTDLMPVSGVVVAIVM